MSVYTEIFNKNRINLNDAARKSRYWFEQQARLLGKQNIDAARLIRTSADRNASIIVPGRMYLFKYDPKLRDKLPYWDTYPLVFPFRKLKDGFIGLNMHYLPYQYRIQLLDKLMTFSSNTLLNENTRLIYSWAVINGVSKFKGVEPCVHRYLGNHVQSPFKQIDAIDWATALMLPVESFQGASKQRVWRDSV